jgi:FkbM family methyltransferase
MTLEMATLVGPTGRVIAIEPGVGNLKYLRDHLKGNDLLDRVTIIDAACSDEDGGEVTFFVSSVDGDAAAVGSGHNIVGIDAIMKQSTTLKVREQRVARVSLDGLCARLGIQPSVFKIDVEGAELLVLKGARQTLSCGRPAVRVGFHPFAFPDPQAASNELCALADQAGYRLDGVAPGQLLELAEYNWVAK